jgi:hypothetical protein
MIISKACIISLIGMTSFNCPRMVHLTIYELFVRRFIESAVTQRVEHMNYKGTKSVTFNFGRDLYDNGKVKLFLCLSTTKRTVWGSGGKAALDEVLLMSTQ